MFLKRITVRKDGKVHTYWALIKSVRTARGPRHETVTYLGELGPAERAGWAEGNTDELVTRGREDPK